MATRRPRSTVRVFILLPSVSGATSRGMCSARPIHSTVRAHGPFFSDYARAQLTWLPGAAVSDGRQPSYPKLRSRPHNRVTASTLKDPNRAPVVAIAKLASPPAAGRLSRLHRLLWRRLASKDVYSKTASSDLVSPLESSSIGHKGGRLLRSTASADATRREADDQERAGVFEKLGNLLWKLCKGKAECMDELRPMLHRSNSAPLIPSEKMAAAPILTRAKTISHQHVFNVEAVLKMLKYAGDDIEQSLKKVFVTMVKQRRDPDEVAVFFNLHPKVQLSRQTGKNAMLAAKAQANPGEYYLFYKYYLFFKDVNPSWTSKFERATGA
ncbi:hypothetical protein PHYSODRAFT_298872 [Phytophthora sojae]|uniref:RxLR effector protein n=1 Tax=Phytophthora sojae (strain P6497) TaxID=1094619 RepID=G4Z622_PHYSP|nr:hypothetical protein PHYSODRAFT_298872 [Phytophthora sojae]EGZ20943.1 hypothetical protein PHYSODRAFT_298872 [Phytophthora sojae]|eukprot:XP_009523660.1 hypothetical protein PHYSODRAFT_298872 [Phytophthora sojae]